MILYDYSTSQDLFNSFTTTVYSSSAKERLWVTIFHEKPARLTLKLQDKTEHETFDVLGGNLCVNKMIFNI